MMMSSPEPMTLGSPTQSPGQSANVNQFLPQFLMGDQPAGRPSQSMNQSKFWQASNPTSSPPKSHLGAHLFQSQSSLSRSYSLSAYDAKHDRPESTYGSTYNPITPVNDRTLGSTSILGSNLNQTQSTAVPGGPPINRLADMMSKQTFPTANLFNTPNDSRSTSFFQEHKPEMAGAPSSQVNRLSPPSPTQLDPFYTYGEQIKADDKLDDTWITVFGFPQSATSYVLQEFSIYGQIVGHASTQGNWLHIQYQTKLQAQKALSKNGKVLANNIMVGVMKCIDKSVMSGQIVSSAFEQQGEAGDKLSKLRAVPSGAKLDRSQSLRTGIRPLGQFNRSQESQDRVHGSKMPRKNTNVLSKAMEYMFGW
ncbi:nucleoporin NUP53 [Brachionus plicatilis]|uniref:Nucleoporin NUP35 n=1 Tax=Brachionus plicatilis TaxID=10195 RepID=A0A3M7QL00_BRAPC|nr:nucleoporin NUP53 [Brachionus plicatilis]